MSRNFQGSWTCSVKNERFLYSYVEKLKVLVSNSDIPLCVWEIYLLGEIEKVHMLYWITWKELYCRFWGKTVFSFIPKGDWIVSAFTLSQIFCLYWMHIPLYVWPHSMLYFLRLFSNMVPPPQKSCHRLKYKPHNIKKNKVIEIIPEILNNL